MDEKQAGTFGGWLQSLARARGIMTDTDLAARAGCKVGTIQFLFMLHRPTNLMDRALGARIADVLQTDRRMLTRAWETTPPAEVPVIASPDNDETDTADDTPQSFAEIDEIVNRRKQPTGVRKMPAHAERSAHRSQRDRGHSIN